MIGRLCAVVAAMCAAPGLAEAQACSELGAPLVDHSCFHARFGPFASVTAGTAARPASDVLDAAHTYFRIALDAARAPAMISYTPARSGSWAVFSQHAVSFALRDPSGAALPAQQLEAVPPCPFFTRVQVVSLEAGTRYQLVIAPTPLTELGIVFEKLDDFVAIHGRDRDGDGFGDPSEVTVSPCAPAAGDAANDLDCDDRDPTIHPGASERCDGVDRDCDGIAGGAGASCHAGIGRCAVAAIAACPIAGEPPICSATPAPPIAEQCDGVDDDCDGIADTSEPLCGDPDQPRCIADGAGGNHCGCETDADCGDPHSARLCQLSGTSQRCIDGCVDGFGRNTCPSGQRCSSTDPAHPGTCMPPESGGCTSTGASVFGAILLLLTWCLATRRKS